MAKISAILERNKFSATDLPEFENKLFFEGDRAGPYLVRFSVLLFLSTVIAALGVIENSTAAVIGAMIIAPMMTPIVATAAALIMGIAHRAWRSFLTVIAGALGVIIVSAGLGFVGIHVVDITNNPQITARVAPRLIDLLIALASGTAGAVAISRSDIADSLPGVAISISLVPPLCVAGISLSAAHWIDALGALLLFFTNFLSILLAGGTVFALLSLGKAVTEDMSHLNKRRAYRIIIFGLVLIAIPLTIATTKVARDTIAQKNIMNLVSQWVSQNHTDFAIKSVLVSGGKAKIIISGPERPSTIEDLFADIQSDVAQIEKVDFLYVPSIRYVYP